MKRKVNLLVLFLVAVFILALALVACGKVNLSNAPATVGQEDPGEDVATKAGNSDDNLMLRFVFTKYMSSVFTKIPLSVVTAEDFDIGDIVSYQIIYPSGVAFDNRIMPLTLDMIDEECRPLLQSPGKHTIRVSLPVGGRRVPIQGAFVLNVAEAESNIEFINLKFRLNGGTACFGKPATENDTQVITVQKGMQLDSWTEFERYFLTLKSGYVIDSLLDSTNKKVYSSGSTEPIVFSQDATYSLSWTDAIVTVKFDINTPNGAIFRTDKDADLFREELVDRQIKMDTGLVPKPDAETINAYYGYNFAGWYSQKDGGERWLFTQNVRREGFTLYAHWTPEFYSLTLYTMGGTFKNNAASTITDTTGLTFVDAEVQFDLASGNANKITFSGFSYNVAYDKYVANIRTNRNSDDTITVKVIDILSVLEKAGGSFENNGIYRDEIHTDRILSTAKVLKDETVYVEWILDEDLKAPNKEDELIEVLSDYYTNYAFKDGITLKADGTLRIDKLTDASMNEFILTSELRWEGELHPVTEIGYHALVDSKSLVTVDLSRATNLTTIGTRAFGSCVYLKDVVFPTHNNITEVGEDAFAKTYWQEHPTFDGGKTSGIIKIGTALYKYTGKDVDKVEDLDMSDLGFYEVGDKKVYNISAGCFSEATALKTITISDNINYIHNNAFKGLVNLKTVTSGSRLEYIGESAFDAKFLEQTTNVDNGAVVIGNILYRIKNPATVTSYEVKSNIVNIAPSAFKDCVNLSTVTFEDESKLKTVGKDAFITTDWVKDKTFTIVSGILTTVYSQSYTYRNAVIPDNVTVIAEYAFNTYASLIETVEMRGNLEIIEDYAFAGGLNLKSFIFTDAAVKSQVVEGKTVKSLTNIPRISNYSFANSKGVLASGVKLYFTKEVYDYLGTADCAESDPVWYELFRLNKDAFRVETIIDAYINPAIKQDRILDGTNVAFGNEHNGIVAESNSGVKKYFDLDLTENSVKYYTPKYDGNGDPVLDNDGKQLYNEVTIDPTIAEGTYFIEFTFNGTVYKHFYDDHAFFINAHNAIMGKPEIGSTLNADGNTSSSIFWIEGFTGDVAGTVPTFYTSHKLDLSKLKFCYRDYTSAPKYLEISQAMNFNPTISREGKVEFTVDFYGIGVYHVTMTYKGVLSLYEAIIQKEAISIPLNGNANTYLKNAVVYLRGQDGALVEEHLTLTSETFQITQVDNKPATALVTNKLGQHTAKIRYTNKKALPGGIEALITYAVVLEADNSTFTVETVSPVAKTARITACTTKTADTLVLPDKYTIEETVNGKKVKTTYTVTEIGKGAFKDFVNLRTVYMPATIEKVSDSAFEGCTLLAEIFTATQQEYQANEIESTMFTDTSISIVSYGTVEISELLFPILPTIITVPNEFTWTETDGITTTKYIATPVFTDDLFKKVNGTIWLYDTEYNREYARLNLSGKSVEFYTEADKRNSAAQSRFRLNTSKFVLDKEYKKVEAQLKGNLKDIPQVNGNIVITPSFTQPIEFSVREIEELRGVAGGTIWLYKSAENQAFAQKYLMEELSTEEKLSGGANGTVWLYDDIANKAYANNSMRSLLESGRVKFYLTDEDLANETTGAKEGDCIVDQGRKILSVTYSKTSLTVVLKKDAKVKFYTSSEELQDESTGVKDGDCVVEQHRELVSVVNDENGIFIVVKKNAQALDATRKIWVLDNEANRALINEYLADVASDSSIIKFYTTEQELNDPTTGFKVGDFKMPEKFEFEYAIYETDYITSTVDILTVPKTFSGFVYLPDTILNKVTIKKDQTNGTFNEMLTIYKSGSSTLVSTQERVPDSLEYIGKMSFKDCLSLATLTIGENSKLADIDAMAFSGSGLENLVLINTSVEEISNQAFENCASLTNIVLPDTVKIIGNNAFLNCTRLKFFMVTTGIETISDNAFLGCYRLVEVFNLSSLEITIPTDETEKGRFGGIADYALRVFSGGGSNISTDENGYVVYTVSESEEYLIDYVGGANTIAVPDSVTAINGYALYGLDQITAVTIPSSVTKICANALKGCDSLTTINFKGTEIAWKAIDKEDGWDGDLEGYEVKFTL